MDALRSVVISQRLLGTREIAVIRHKDCGMLSFETNQLRKTVKDAEPGNAAVANAVDSIDFLTFDNLEESVKQEVKYLQEHPLVLRDTVVTGWVYDVGTGKVSKRQDLYGYSDTKCNSRYRSPRLFNSIQRDIFHNLVFVQFERGIV